MLKVVHCNYMCYYVTFFAECEQQYWYILIKVKFWHRRTSHILRWSAKFCPDWW